MQDYKSFDDQIQILKARHLTIKDEKEAKKILTIHNYYNVINGYKSLFCYIDPSTNKEFFTNGASFDEIYALYCFDRELRSIIFKYTLQIENTLRTLVSHIFSKYHGVDNYLKYSNFDCIQYKSASKKKIDDRAQHINELISKMQMDLARATIKKDYINHYVVKHGYVPLWVLVNTISFSRLSTFFNLMKQSERIEISMHWNILEKELSSYIEILAYFRNLCAHDDRLYNAKSKKSISNTAYHLSLNISKDKNGNYMMGKKDIFAVIIASKILLPPDQFKTMINKIRGETERLSQKLFTIKIEDVFGEMGFPKNWCDIKK